jgi:hypothetical protein
MHLKPSILCLFDVLHYCSLPYDIHFISTFEVECLHMVAVYIYIYIQKRGAHTSLT